ncbi:MAG: HD domain-containing protein [Candidatus Nanohaloarchaea archaeon]
MSEGLTKEELQKLKESLKEEFSGYSEIAGGKNYRYQHLETTHKHVCKFQERLDVEVDNKVLEIAALYHDIGRVKDIVYGEMDPFEGNEGHAEHGAKIVEEYISDFVSKEQLEKIKEIIENHHSEASTIEGKIVQDADKVSNFGVFNLWRQIHYSAQHERTLEESLDYFWNKAVSQFENHIEEMHFEETSELARNRLEKHKDTIREIEREINAEDFLIL